jgi:hypothetical protein
MASGSSDTKGILSSEEEIVLDPRFLKQACLRHSKMAFFGKYLEVAPHSRLVWTNEEREDGTLVAMDGGMPESFEQLDELLVTLGVSVPRS